MLDAYILHTLYTQPVKDPNVYDACMVMCLHSTHANMYIIAYIQRPNANMYKFCVNADHKCTPFICVCMYISKMQDGR